MAKQATVEQITDYIGQEVSVKGWLYAKTGKGRLQFLQVRDGTGVIQCVVFKKKSNLALSYLQIIYLALSIIN